MSDENKRARAGAGDAPVPVEFERFMRPGPVTASPGAPQTPLHDRVTDTGLSHFAGLFRDESASDPGRSPVAEDMAVAARQGMAGSAMVAGRPAMAGSERVGTPMAGTGVAPPRSSAAVPPPPNPAPLAPRTPTKKRRWRRVLLWILVVLLVYFTLLAAVFAFSVNKINAMPPGQPADTAGDVYLLVGSDGRGKLSKQQRRELHTGSVEGNRTDTIMLLQVPLIGKPTLVSLPRDSWVSIPGRGSNKINAAFALGGPPLLIETVERATGLRVDHYVEVGMGGIADITNALGGVTLCPTRKYDDKNSGLHVKAGCQVMDGKTALAYVRMRYADPKGDLGREQRQQEFIRAVITKTANPLTWLNPIKMFNVDRTAAGALTVDQGTGIVADFRLGLAMAMLSAGWGQSTTVPVASDDYRVDGQQAVKWDTPKALELFRSMGAE